MCSKDWGATASYDYQYVGRGLGAVDVAYLLVCSSSSSVLKSSEEQLLAHYHHHLMACLRERGHTDTSYTLDVLREHYDYAQLDLYRFMGGWGWWGAVSPSDAQKRARQIVSARNL